MTSKSIRRLKLLIYPILLFFCWTNLGIYNIAYAATVGAYGDTPLQKIKSPEEKFQESLERLRDAVGKEDTAKIKTERAEIEKHDVEIKKQFKETEEKIKDLPEAVKQRHREFVRKYEENLNALKGNLDGIEKAKNKAEEKIEVEKAKAFLEKTKAPKRHVPLDPNKLPHRTPEIKKREPRTKPEEFEKSSAKGSIVGWAVPTERLLDLNRSLTTDHRPLVQVASNGPLTGLVSDLPTTSTSPLALSSPLSQGEGQGEGGVTPNSERVTGVMPYAPTNTILALNTTDSPTILALNALDLPTGADLSQTIEVQFTDDINAKAAELGNNPVKIYEWVRNNIEYVPTYGSIQGADMCLQTKQCNDFDTASLLIALLRASNISARYVYGTIELPIEKAMNWVGGFTNEQSAVNFIASGGVPIKAYASGGKIAKVQMEHVWVEGWVDMIPSGGAVYKQGDTWVPLDGSYKQYTHKTGMDLYSSLSFNGDQFMSSYIADTQDITPYQQYGKQMISWLDANLPTATIEDILGAQDLPSAKAINQQTFPYLLGTLPYKVVVKGGKYSETPDSLRHKATIEITSDTFGGLSITKSLPELSGKRLTLSYVPATTTDETLITQYGGDMLKVPPYMLNVKPVLKINGLDAATGSSVGMGATQTFTINLYTPANGSDIIQNYVVAGTYSAITIQAHKTPVEIAGARMATLQSNSKNIDVVTLDDLLGEFLSAIGLSYFHHLTFENDLYAKTFQVAYLKQPSEAMTTLNINISYLFGLPRVVSQGGLNIDVDRDTYTAVALSGDTNREKQFMMIAGMTSSAWEHKIFEAFVSTPSVSAVKLLKYANQQGIPIYTIDNSNINQLLPTLQISHDVKSDIQNAVNAGKKVIVSQSEVQYYEWKGTGYVVLDPMTGTGGYMISGGLAGGGTAMQPCHRVLDLSKKSDYAALMTTFTRKAVVELALTMLGTMYVWSAESPECGFDCSGFVYYVFTSVYGKNAFPWRCGIRDCTSGCAKCQHDYLQSKGWVYPYSDRFPGDILWSNGYGHTGIYYDVDTVIHASGKPCGNPDDPNGWLPSDSLPLECRPVADTTTRICGKYKMVIVTSVNDPYFAYNGGVATDIGRPQP